MEQSEILALIEKLTTASKREARRISAKLENGTIDVDEWKAAILALLVSSHIIAASVGRGGRSAMTSSDWQKVSDKVAWQESYLTQLREKIVAGGVIVAAGVIAARAVKYFDAPYISFSSAFREKEIESTGGKVMVRLITNSVEGCSECADDEAEGWMDLEDCKELGDRICGDWCKCFLEFSSNEMI